MSSQRRKKTRRGRLGLGALLSLLLHAQVLVPLGIATFIYAAREEAERPEEIDVSFDAPEDFVLPKDLPSLDVEEPRPRLERERPRKDRQKRREALAEKAKPPAPREPEPEIPVPPLPPMPKPEAPPPPPEPPKAHEKMVDLDMGKEVEPPPDAKFLAQRNNRAEEETRATETNLEREQKGSDQRSSAAPSDRQDQEVGDEKERIAELDDVKSKLGRQAPPVTPHVDPHPEQQQQQPETRPKSLLALRETERREHEITPETVDPSLPRTEDGMLPSPSQRGARARRAEQASAGQRKLKLAITGKDYEYLFGAEADADRRLAQKERSKRRGRFEQRLERVRSALENFIPEVKPGNQTALNTRAAPFAAYVARMHRSIHKLWGFGILEEWDEKAGSNPFNNPNLLTTLEMVLNGDGTVDKVTVIQTSGYLAYDIAAIDVAYSAGPYPDPPREIRSGNGKIYIHWRFHRDGRQCATSGVDYFILNNAPAGGDSGSAAAPSAATPARAQASLAPPRPPDGGASSRALRRLERDPAREAKLAHLDREVAQAEEAAGLQPSSLDDGHGHGAGDGHGHGGGPALPRANDPAARHVAETWFAAFRKGDLGTMLDRAAYPFRAANGTSATTRAELSSMLRGLSDELPRAALKGVELFTGAALRGVIGKLPPSFDDGSGMMFALGQVGNDGFVLALRQMPSGWKAVGLMRR